MQVVVVIAHPNPDSFTHAVADAACKGLRAGGHTVHALDLHAVGFRAAMSAEEHAAYHGDVPAIDPLVIESVALVRQAEALVFVYPTWWSSLPAILRGWLERVMLPGVAFVFDERGKVRPGLRNVRRVVGISTYGSPWAYVRLMNDNGRRAITRALRLNTGIRTRTAWLALYGIDNSTLEQRNAFMARVEKRMRSL